MVDFGFGVADPVQHGILPWPGSALGDGSVSRMNSVLALRDGANERL